MGDDHEPRLFEIPDPRRIGARPAVDGSGTLNESDRRSPERARVTGRQQFALSKTRCEAALIGAGRGGRTSSPRADGSFWTLALLFSRRSCTRCRMTADGIVLMNPGASHKIGRMVPLNAGSNRPRRAVMPSDICEGVCAALAEGERLVCLIGPAESGKSALVSALRRVIPGFVGIVHEPLEDCGAIAIANALALRNTGDDEDAMQRRIRMFHAVVKSRKEPVTVLIDDAHLLRRAQLAEALEFLHPMDGRLVLAGLPEVLSMFDERHPGEWKPPRFIFSLDGSAHPDAAVARGSCAGAHSRMQRVSGATESLVTSQRGAFSRCPEPARSRSANGSPAGSRHPCPPAPGRSADVPPVTLDGSRPGIPPEEPEFDAALGTLPRALPRPTRARHHVRRPSRTRSGFAKLVFALTLGCAAGYLLGQSAGAGVPWWQRWAPELRAADWVRVMGSMTEEFRQGVGDRLLSWGQQLRSWDGAARPGTGHEAGGDAARGERAGPPTGIGVPVGDESPASVVRSTPGPQVPGDATHDVGAGHASNGKGPPPGDIDTEPQGSAPASQPLVGGSGEAAPFGTHAETSRDPVVPTTHGHPRHAGDAAQSGGLRPTAGSAPNISHSQAPVTASAGSAATRADAERARYELRRGRLDAALLSTIRGLAKDPGNPKLEALRLRILAAMDRSARSGR